MNTYLLKVRATFIMGERLKMPLLLLNQVNLFKFYTYLILCIYDLKVLYK